MLDVQVHDRAEQFVAECRLLQADEKLTAEIVRALVPALGVQAEDVLMAGIDLAEKYRAAAREHAKSEGSGPNSPDWAGVEDSFEQVALTFGEICTELRQPEVRTLANMAPEPDPVARLIELMFVLDEELGRN